MFRAKVRRVAKRCLYMLVALLATSCAHTTRPVLESPLTATGESWIAYYKSGDLDGLMTLYVDDAIVALHGQPMLRGIDEIKTYFSNGIGQTNVEFDLEYEMVETHGDIAHAMAKYWLVSRSKETGEVVYQDAGRSLLIYKRDADGRWKIAVDIDQATPDVTFD